MHGKHDRFFGNGWQTTLAIVACGFGLATIGAGARVLSGGDPGYEVYRPLLVFNTAMGFAYLLAGVLMWRHPGRGVQAAAAIFAVNLIGLLVVAWLYRSDTVAAQSVLAMAFRMLVWGGLWAGLAWLRRRPGRFVPGTP